MTTINTNGIVKWFNTGKGFGYVVTQQGELRVDDKAAGEFAEQLVPGKKASLEVEVLKTFRKGQHIDQKTVVKVTAVEDGPQKPCVVKWYDAKKGYGFVNIAGTDVDARLGKQVCEVAGALPASGMAMMAVVIDSQKGPEVLSFETSAEIQEQYEDVMVAMLRESMVPAVGKFYNPKGKYGFVRLADGTEAHVRVSVLKAGGVQLQELEPMRVAVQSNRKNPKKFDVVACAPAEDGDAEAMAEVIAALKDERAQAEAAKAAKSAETDDVAEVTEALTEEPTDTPTETEAAAEADDVADAKVETEAVEETGSADGQTLHSFAELGQLNLAANG